jgi:C-terminal processing protease CtpA/Prc
MRKNPILILAIFLIGFYQSAISQTYWFKDRQELTGSGLTIPPNLSAVQQENLNVLCRVWGIVKYFHSLVAGGNMNVDKALFTIMPEALRANRNEFQKLLIKWVDALGPVTATSWTRAPDNIFKQSSMDWLNRKPVGGGLGERLKYIISNRYQDTGFYVHPTYPLSNPDFSNEFRYKNVKGEDGGMRMLALFRYWNTVEYFYPSKYLTADNWDSVLRAFIPRYAAAQTDKDYRLLCVELAATIHDTHANNITADSVFIQSMGAYTIPVWLAEVQDSMVVYFYSYDSLKNNYPLQPGDRLIAVNGKDVWARLAEIKPYITASNRSSFMNYAVNRVKRSAQQDNIFTIIRGTDTLHQKIRSVLAKDMPTAGLRNHVSAVYPMYRKIDDDIGYINIGKIKADSLPAIFKAFANTKALIIDQRNYPSDFVPFALGKYLKPKPSTFVRFTEVDYKMPGRFLMRDSDVNGTENPGYYKGKVVILVYQQSQSQAEFTVMGLRTAPDVIVMGSQTSGADGNVSNVFFPGGMASYISGYGIYYPDMTPTQGIGIVPDIVVKPTIAGLRRGEDELLDSAIKYIRSDTKKK